MHKILIQIIKKDVKKYYKLLNHSPMALLIMSGSFLHNRYSYSSYYYSPYPANKGENRLE